MVMMMNNPLVISLLLFFILTVTSGSALQHKVKLGANGKAYKVNNRVPEKHDISKEHKTGIITIIQHHNFIIILANPSDNNSEVKPAHLDDETER